METFLNVALRMTTIYGKRLSQTFFDTLKVIKSYKREIWSLLKLKQIKLD